MHCAHNSQEHSEKQHLNSEMDTCKYTGNSPPQYTVLGGRWLDRAIMPLRLIPCSRVRLLVLPTLKVHLLYSFRLRIDALFYFRIFSSDSGFFAALTPFDYTTKVTILKREI